MKRRATRILNGVIEIEHVTEEFDPRERPEGYNNNKSRFSKDVQILALIEKIWVMYDMDANGDLEYEEIKPYLKAISSVTG